MRLPQSKERIGTALLLIVSWLLILAVVFTSKCGSPSDVPPLPDTTTTVPPALTDTPSPDSLNDTKSKRKKSRKKSHKKSLPAPVRNVLEDTIS